MKASQVVGVLMLAGACLPAQAQPHALADADLLYCAQVYAEGAALLRTDPAPGVRRTGRDALLRSRALGASDIDLLNEDPARHKQASTQAQKRLSAMPAAPLEARRLALRAAYVECRHLQASAGTAAAPGSTPKASPAHSAASAEAPADPSAATAASAASARAVDIELDDLIVSAPVAGPEARAATTAPDSGKGSTMRQLWRGRASRPKAATAAVPAPAPGSEPDGPAAPHPVADTMTLPDIAAPESSKDSKDSKDSNMKQFWHAFASRPRAATAAVSAPAAGTAASAPVFGTGIGGRRAARPGPASAPLDASTTVAPTLPPEPRENDDDILAAVAATAPRPAADNASSPPASDGLDDADLLFCAQVYAETASLLGQDRNTDLRRMAEEAQRRSQPLSERDYDLLNEDPQRHAHASAEAGKRLSTLPTTPAHARRTGLRKAYAECRELQDGKPEVATALPKESLPAAAMESVAPRAPDPRPVRAPAAVPAPVPVPVRAPVQATASKSVTAPASTSSSAPAPRQSGLSDADMLYCEQIYGEVAGSVGDAHADAAEAARDARERWRPLNERGYDLLNDEPARHSRASAAARQRLAALPEKPGRARSVALRAAYDDCRRQEDLATTTATPATGGDRVRMRAKRHFCRDLLLSKLKVSPTIRAGLTPSESAALDEIQRIGGALAQPLPGAALTLEQGREADQLAAQLREALDLAVANWSDGQDPVVQAMGQCHDDYAQGLLGGPDVLSQVTAEAPPATPLAPTLPTLPTLPTVRLADLGPVFHMREMTPAGNFDGIWFRRGRTNIYDAVWVQAASGQMQRDVLELRGIVDGELTLYRQSYHGSYRARVRPNGTLAPGEASWFNSSAYSWSPLPPQYVRAATGDLGAIVHMREVTPYGNYDGIWRQRGQTGVYDVIWVFLPTGEITADVLAVMGVAKGQLIIRRQNGPGIYPLKRRADSMAYKDAAKGGKVRSQWVVLPAQSVRLGDAAR